MHKYILSIILLSIQVCLPAQLPSARIPARRDPIPRIQPNGDTLIVLLRGDERSHRTLTLDGWQIKENDKGYLCYAIQKKDGSLIASKRVAHNEGQRTCGESRWLKNNGILIPQVQRKPPRRLADGTLPEWGKAYLKQTHTAQPAHRLPEQAETYLPTNIAPRGLVIVANFADLNLREHEGYAGYRAYVDSMLNGEHFVRDYDYEYQWQGVTVSGHLHHEGSAKQYFEASSAGQYKPVFDVVGPVTLSKNQSYYGHNSGNSDIISRINEVIYEAAQQAHSQYGVDFSIYDNNNDGVVDFVYVLYAGLSEADTGIQDYIWPCSGNYTGTSIQLNGKRLGRWAVSAEMNLNGYADGLGTIAHEFGHVLGLPDFYTTNGAYHKTMGSWDVMDYGCYNNEGNTPPLYNAQERFLLGWLTPTLITQAMNDTLHYIGTSNEARIITESDISNLIGSNPDPQTYWMLENRQQTGWDAPLEGHGLMITKIVNSSKWTLSTNTVNNTVSAMGFDLVEADGVATDDEWYGKPTDLFPAGATAYTAIANHSITDIQEVDGVITYKFKGGIATDHPDITTDRTDTPTKKVLRNGQILIERGKQVYTILGQKL